MPLTVQPIIPVCCVCGLIRENGSSTTVESWVTKKVFQRTHQIEASAYRFTHTYCPACYTQFMSRIAAA